MIIENDTTPFPVNKAELLACIHREWLALEQSIDSMSDRQLILPGRGGWSVKDHLAHLATWERFAYLHHLRDLPPYEVLDVDPLTFGRGDEDELNAILHERNKNRSLPEIQFELRCKHQTMLTDLENRPFADLMRQQYADDPEARPVLCFVINNTYEHYVEHRKSIEQLPWYGRTG